MGWEYRAGGGPYYIRRQGVNGQREYCGKGPAAERAAAEDAVRRAERDACRAERRQVEAMDAEVEVLHRTVDLLSKGVLIGAGFHQHNRGEWRKWRHGTHPITGE